MDNFSGIHHGSVVVRNTEQSLQFYCAVLGMREKPRAGLPYPGAWLAVGNQELHLLELPNPDPVAGRPKYGGHDRHIAVVVRDLSAIASALEAANIHYDKGRSGRAALFCRDPDGNAIEVIESTGD